MEIRDLDTFVVLAAEGNFGKAANRVHISTAQVSQRIKKLEQSVGGRLFYRTTREVRLTELGRELLNGARPLLEAHTKLTQRMQDRADGQIGTIRLALNISATYTVLPSLLRIVAERRPGVNIRVVNAQGFTSILEAALLESRVDMIVARAPLAHPQIESIPLFREPMAVIVPPAHRLSNKELVEPTDLDGEALVSFPLDSASAIAPAVDQVLRQEGINVRRRAEADETTGLLGLVSAGLGVTIAPRSVSALAPDLKCIPLSGMPITEMLLAWHKDNQDELISSTVRLIKETGTLSQSEMNPHAPRNSK